MEFDNQSQNGNSFNYNQHPSMMNNSYYHPYTHPKPMVHSNHLPDHYTPLQQLQLQEQHQVLGNEYNQYTREEEYSNYCRYGENYGRVRDEHQHQNMDRKVLSPTMTKPESHQVEYFDESRNDSSTPRYDQSASLDVFPCQQL